MRLWYLISLLLLTLLSNCTRGGDFSWIKPSVSANGSTLLYSSRKAGNASVTLKKLMNGDNRTLTDLKNDETWPSFGFDQKSIIFTRETGVSASIWIRDGVENHPKQLTGGIYFDRDAVQLAETEWVFFSRAHRRRAYSQGGLVWRSWDICCISTNGGEVFRLTTENSFQMDGLTFISSNAIVVSAQILDRVEEKSIFQLELPAKPNANRTLSLKLIASLGKWSMNHAVWNGWRQRIYFTSNRDSTGRFFNYEIYSIKRDGSDLRCHTELGGICRSLSVSQSDGSVYFTLDTERNGHLSLMRLNTDTHRVHELYKHLF